ncbi:MAG: L-rhamnose/proton symporter RhaT [Planctomycetota bacterium]|nr:MAG: L-rhamnose/proton symporter RhaT [Planctomycetota bacterium]
MNPVLGIIFHAIGGAAAGSFYAPCKRVKGWAWETYWLMLGVFAWIAAPLLTALIVMPNFFEVYDSVPIKVIFWAYFFGVLWGIGGLTFGLTMRYLGISLGVSVALGFCAMFGTLIPPVFEQFFGDPASGETTITELLTTTSGQVTLGGIAVCLLGIIICGKAGMMKEKELSVEQKAEGIKEFDFFKGITVAIVAGVLSACMAYAFTAGAPVQAKAVEMGLRPVLSNIPLLVIVLLGGFTTNCLWCFWLSIKNKTYSDYANAPKGFLLLNYMLCMLAGTLWYLQFFFYGMGSTQMGKYDFASWTLHMALIIVTSNMIGLLTHEWKGSSKNTIRCVLAGIAVLILSTIIVGVGNKLGAAPAVH